MLANTDLVCDMRRLLFTHHYCNVKWEATAVGMIEEVKEWC